MAAQRPVFKPYHQTQTMAIPPTLDELVAKGHPVRIVNRINIQGLLDAYKIRGTSSYHPQMLLKILVYGYVSNVYSSRKLETACKENINFMWLSGMSYPDHNAINRFRGVRLKDALRSVFEEVVKLLAAEGLVGHRRSLHRWYQDRGQCQQIHLRMERSHPDQYRKDEKGTG